MRAAMAIVVFIAALSALSPAQGLDYFTGQTSRRRLQQGPGGGTCLNGPKSAQYRCMSLTARSSGYQFCARLCQSGLGTGASSASDADSSAAAPSAGNGGNSSRLETEGGLGGATLGGAAGAGSCMPCVDVQQRCQQGEGGGGGFGNAYYRAYVNRYYSGAGCQDVGPAVTIGRGSSGSTAASPSDSPSDSSGSPSPASGGGR